MINAASAVLAAKCGVTELRDTVPNVGDQFGPWDVVSVGDGAESFWWYGGPIGEAFPSGTVVRMFADDNQRYRIDGRDDGAAIMVAVPNPAQE